MKKRVAIVGIFMKKARDYETLNEIMQAYNEHMVSKMEVVNAHGDISVISIVMDTTEDTVCAFAGKVSALRGIDAKVIFAKDAKKY